MVVPKPKRRESDKTQGQHGVRRRQMARAHVPQSAQPSRLAKALKGNMRSIAGASTSEKQEQMQGYDHALGSCPKPPPSKEHSLGASRSNDGSRGVGRLKSRKWAARCPTVSIAQPGRAGSHEWALTRASSGRRRCPNAKRSTFEWLPVRLQPAFMRPRTPAVLCVS